MQWMKWQHRQPPQRTKYFGNLSAHPALSRRTLREHAGDVQTAYRCLLDGSGCAVHQVPRRHGNELGLGSNAEASFVLPSPQPEGPHRSPL